MVAPLFVYVSAVLYICPLYVNSHTGIKSGVLTPSVLFGPAACLACALQPRRPAGAAAIRPARRAIEPQFPVPRAPGR